MSCRLIWSSRIRSYEDLAVFCSFSAEIIQLDWIYRQTSIHPFIWVNYSLQMARDTRHLRSHQILPQSTKAILSWRRPIRCSVLSLSSFKRAYMQLQCIFIALCVFWLQSYLYIWLFSSSPYHSSTFPYQPTSWIGLLVQTSSLNSKVVNPAQFSPNPLWKGICDCCLYWVVSQFSLSANVLEQITSSDLRCKLKSVKSHA